MIIAPKVIALLGFGLSLLRTLRERSGASVSADGEWDASGS